MTLINSFLFHVVFPKLLCGSDAKPLRSEQIPEISVIRMSIISKLVGSPCSVTESLSDLSGEKRRRMVLVEMKCSVRQPPRAALTVIAED